MALECLGKSDALYHNVEHTLLVTLVGLDILRGRMLTERLEPDDYAHLVVACLLHDIGYVRGLLKGDGGNSFVVDASGRRVTLPRGASDAALAPYHVERSILFVRDRLGGRRSSMPIAWREPLSSLGFPAAVHRVMSLKAVKADWCKGPISSGNLGIRST